VLNGNTPGYAVVSSPGAISSAGINTTFDPEPLYTTCIATIGGGTPADNTPPYRASNPGNTGGAATTIWPGATDKTGAAWPLNNTCTPFNSVGRFATGLAPRFADEGENPETASEYNPPAVTPLASPLNAFAIPLSKMGAGLAVPKCITDVAFPGAMGANPAYNVPSGKRASPGTPHPGRKVAYSSVDPSALSFATALDTTWHGGAPTSGLLSPKPFVAPKASRTLSAESIATAPV
jgi:hypothetical protein